MTSTTKPETGIEYAQRLQDAVDAYIVQANRARDAGVHDVALQKKLNAVFVQPLTAEHYERGSQIVADHIGSICTCGHEFGHHHCRDANGAPVNTDAACSGCRARIGSSRPAAAGDGAGGYFCRECLEVASNAF